MSLVQGIAEGLDALGLDVPFGAPTKLAAYLELLAKWNKTYNLTAVRDIHEMVAHHVLDSLTVLPYIEKSAVTGRQIDTLVDVGSGAGFPGIPLAIVRPNLRITLVDAVDKKSAFQRQAKTELGLANVSVVGARVEGLMAGGFDVVVSRAFAELANFVALAGHLANPDGRLYAMKGVLPESELQCLPSPWRVEEIVPLRIPGQPVQRHLIVLKKS